MKSSLSAMALGAGVLLLLLASCGPKPSDGPGPAVTTTKMTGGKAAAEAVPGDFLKLVGRWERPDGGYVLELKNPNSSGTFEATYFNPSPIHVAKAMAVREAGKIRVFVELQDVNYPGCTYSLEYDSQHDHLFGQYFQAAVQQTYDVTFGRLK